MVKNNIRELKVVSRSTPSDENIFEQIVDKFPDIIHSVDENGLIISSNQCSADLLGYDKDELVGKSIYEIYPEEIKKKVKAGFDELKSHGVKKSVESKLVSKDGEIIDVEIRSLSLYNEKGKFIRTLSIIRDIRQHNNLKNQIVQQGKLAAVGELAAGIMHDIRNPLTVISAYNNTFLKTAIEQKDFELMKKCQDSIEKAAERIQRLSDHMRNFTRSESEPLTLIDLNDLVKDSLLMLETKFKYTGSVLNNEITNSGIRFKCHPNKLEQVLINLISNACDAVARSKEKIITLSAQDNANNIAISIKDTGSGIPPENEKKIFESFFTTKSRDVGDWFGTFHITGDYL